ncbi:hypothetical protein ACJX0J_035538, partial [Zea mays]
MCVYSELFVRFAWMVHPRNNCSRRKQNYRSANSFERKRPGKGTLGQAFGVLVHSSRALAEPEAITPG